MRKLCFLSVILIVLISGLTASGMPAAQAADAAELTIIRITPDGEDVSATRQIVVQFSRDVVPVGEMARNGADIPVTITPPVACEWRWLNRSALSCNLAEADALKPATRYEMLVKPGIQTEDGMTLAEPVSHVIQTQRPDVSAQRLQIWQGPTRPQWQVMFNQPVSRRSVEASLYFTLAESAGRHYGVRVTANPGDAKAEAHVAPHRKSGDAVLSVQAPRAGSALEARTRWLVEPTRDLPEDSAMSLMLRPGLISAIGTQPGIAERELVRFYTFPAFTFLGIKCYSNYNANDDDMILIAPDGANVTERCNPMRGAALAFSSPVMSSDAAAQLQFSPDLAGGRKDYDPWQNRYDYSRLSESYEPSKTYDIWLPTLLKAAQAYQVTTLPVERNMLQTLWAKIKGVFVPVARTTLHDQFGRALVEPVAMAFETNHRKPNFVIAHGDAVIESQTDSEVPLYVNNLEETIFTYRKLDPDHAQGDLTHRQSIPAIQDVQFAIPFNVRDMLGGKSGAVYGSLSTNPSVPGVPNRLFAIVTPYQLHVKLGHFSSIVWVMDMATGEPVADANVTIYQDSLTGLKPVDVPLSRAATDANGVAKLAGTDLLDPKQEYNWRWNDDDERLFVRVDKAGEMALMPLSYDYSVSTYSSVGESIYPDTRERYGHMKSWGMTAQGVYRAGDSIQYKFYVRHQDSKRLIAPPREGYRLVISDPTGNMVEEIKSVTLDAFGAYAGEYALPANAPVGWYEFQLYGEFDLPDADKPKAGAADDRTKTGFMATPIRVLVSDFTPSPFKVSNELDGKAFEAGQPIEVVTQARLHSGGAYGDADIRVTGLLSSRAFTPKDPLARHFTFGSYQGDLDESTVFQLEERVDESGDHEAHFTLPQSDIYYGNLMVESVVKDDRGRSIATRTNAPFAAVNRFVGLRSHDWMVAVGNQSPLDYLVTDRDGKPVADVPVEILFERQETTMAKVKSAGNSYLPEYRHEWVKTGECEEASGKAEKICEFAPDKAGYYRATATIADSQSRPHVTTSYYYVTGDDYVLWNESNNNSLEIIPEKTDYKVGETARYLVKNPYPGAKALVSVERYGVLEHFVTVLEGSTPTIELAITPDHLPGFYLSVVVFSPRVDKPIKDQVDLGKPSFRMGYVTVRVDDPYKEMAVSAQTDRERYEPRETVTVSLQASAKNDRPDEPVELAVVVLDEAVLDLIAAGTRYFDPYAGFYQLDSLDLRNYSLLTRLVGRQKFEKKGANPGGDGGSSLSMRDLFKFVSYWNPSIPTDAEGKAQIEFKVPDNLTGWRVLAMAVTPTDRMGLGEARFVVNKETELRPVMPNQIGEGDAFEAGFSVMNRTDHTRTLDVSIKAEGDLDATQADKASMSKQVTLEPFKRATIRLPLKAALLKPTSASDVGSIRFTATAEDATDGDALSHSLPVRLRRVIQTAASYGNSTEARIQDSVKIPENIYTDVSEVAVVLAPSVIGNLDGAFRYMRDYPYICWEQQLTKGVMASHFGVLNAYLPATLTWPEAPELIDGIASLAASHQTPSGGMAYYTPQDEYADPYLSAYTGIAFNWLRDAGHTVPEMVETKLHDYLGALLRHNAYPYGYSEGMASSVRAVALAVLAEHDAVTESDLARYRPAWDQMSLMGKAYFILASHRIGADAGDRRERVEKLLSYSGQTGGKFAFSEPVDDEDRRILTTPLRDNCAILSVLLELEDDAGLQPLIADVPSKLVRMITQARGNRDAFDNTQENVFCLSALAEYSRRYEQTEPVMDIRVALDDEAPFGTAHFASRRDTAQRVAKPLGPEDAGRAATVAIERDGQGRLYYSTQLRYASRDEAAKPINSGIEIHREYSVERDGKWQLLTSPMVIRPSELVRVDLYVSLPMPRHFVVVDDPIPGGLEPVNRDLATASQIDADKAAFTASDQSWWFTHDDWQSYGVSRWSFYHQELRHHAARFYSDYLPAGNYHLSYAAQAIAPGDYTVMPVRAEEMYDPDVYGIGVVEKLQVESAQ